MWVLLLVDARFVASSPWAPLFDTIYVLEALSICIDVPVLLIDMQILHRNRAYHPNLRTIILSSMVFCTLSVLARFGMLVWQRFFDAEVATADRPSWVIALSVFRIAFLAFCGYNTCSVMMERFFSVIYIESYERDTRPQIAVGILIFAHTMGALNAVCLTWELVPLPILLLQLPLIGVVCFLLFWYVYLRCMRRRRALIEHPNAVLRYSLSEQYQALENIAFCRSLFLVVGFVGLVVLVLGPLFLVPEFVLSPEQDRLARSLLFALFDWALTVAIGVTTTTGVLLLPMPRRAFRNAVATLFGCKIQSPARVSLPAVRANAVSADTELYFRELHANWERRLVAVHHPPRTADRGFRLLSRMIMPTSVQHGNEGDKYRRCTPTPTFVGERR